jgi:DHA2 family multidrug resistance protein-like MFS transporter
MPRETRLVLIACYLAIFAVGENSTAIMAALPAMSAHLGLSAAMAEWAVNAYLLAAAAFIILGGRAADGFGARRASAAGILLFALASLVIALAPDGAAVIAARALQGLGAAFAVAATLAAASEAVPEAGRAAAISGWTGFLMLGFSIGPLLGGAITHYAGWRAVFWLNLAIMLPAGLALTLHPGAAGRKASRVDWPGLGLLALFMVMLISGLQALPRLAAAPWASLLPLLLAALAFLLLHRTERRRELPLLDFALFANRRFTLAALLAALLMFDIMTLLLYYNLFAQSPRGLGLSPIAAGLSLVPLSAALFGFARAAPRIARASGLRPMMVSGALILVLGCAIALVSLAGTGPVMLVIGLFVAGAGIALPYATAPRLGLAALPPTAAGQGAGVINACSFLGATIGVTCGGIVAGFAGFAGVLVLLALAALACAALSLRLEEKIQP